jgi:hypothetical protein
MEIQDSLLSAMYRANVAEDSIMEVGHFLFIYYLFWLSRLFLFFSSFFCFLTSLPILDEICVAP